jgi:hypothetical protein
LLLVLRLGGDLVSQRWVEHPEHIGIPLTSAALQVYFSCTEKTVRSPRGDGATTRPCRPSSRGDGGWSQRVGESRNGAGWLWFGGLVIPSRNNLTRPLPTAAGLVSRANGGPCCVRSLELRVNSRRVAGQSSAGGTSRRRAGRAHDIGTFLWPQPRIWAATMGTDNIETQISLGRSVRIIHGVGSQRGFASLLPARLSGGGWTVDRPKTLSGGSP